MSDPTALSDPTPYARYTLTMPCAHCEEFTVLYSNDVQHVQAVLTSGRLCDRCYHEQEVTR